MSTDPTPATRLLVEITWQGNYYLPSERADVVKNWIADALCDRDDSPILDIREVGAAPEYTADQLVKGAAVTAKVYVEAALDQVQLAVTASVQDLRRRYERDLQTDAPFKSLIKATEEHRG